MRALLTRRAALAALACGASRGARSADAPGLRLLVGFAAGGPTDFIARALAAQLGPALGQAVRVENRPGAGGRQATEAVARARPDGGTLLIAASHHTLLPAVHGLRTGYDALRDFRPICTLANSPSVLVVGPSLPARTLAEAVERIRALDGRASCGTPGVGSTPHLLAEQWRQRSGLSMVAVPYQGAAPLVSALIGGQLDLSLLPLAAVQPHLRAGRLSALAVAAPQRLADWPAVPTFAQAGGPALEHATWWGLLAPAGTPEDVVQRLLRQARAFRHSLPWRAHLEGAGLTPEAVEDADFAARLRHEAAEHARLARTLRLAG